MPVFSHNFKKNRNVLMLFFKNTDIRTICPVEVPLFNVERGADGRTNINSILLQKLYDVA